MPSHRVDGPFHPLLLLPVTLSTLTKHGCPRFTASCGVRSCPCVMSEMCTSPSARPLTPSSCTKHPKSITLDTLPA